jgi:homoserine kinase type II
MIVKGDQLMAIIDFEEACHYYRSFDLGMVIVGACRNREGISFRKAKQFLRGYQNDRTLEPVERESLKAFAVYAAVATSFWRFRQYHLLRPDPRLRDKHVEMQTLADTISGYPDSRFTELFC